MNFTPSKSIKKTFYHIIFLLSSSFSLFDKFHDKLLYKLKPKLSPKLLLIFTVEKKSGKKELNINKSIDFQISICVSYFLYE